MLYTLLILISLILLSGTLLKIFIPKLHAVNETVYSTDALYAADSGTEWCLYENNVNPIKLAMPFDEGSGTTANDYSGYGNNGTLTNGPTWVAGKYVNGISFDGVNDYVRLGNVLNWPSTNSMTISAWINRRNVTNNATIISKKTSNSSTTPGYSLFQWSAANGGNTCFYISDGVGQYETCTPDNSTIDLNQWHFIAVTFDRVNGRAGSSIYIDGVNSEQSSYEVGNPSTLGAVSNNESLCIGTAPVGAGSCTTTQLQFPGTIDNVRIYAKAQSQAEIQADMNTPVPTSIPPVRSPVASPMMTNGSVFSIYSPASSSTPSNCTDYSLNYRTVGTYRGISRSLQVHQ